MAGVSDEIKAIFKQNDVLIRLIIFNAAVFVAIQVVYVLLWLFKIDNFVVIPGVGTMDLDWYYLGAPADLIKLLYKPWTLLTYMFIHADFWHLFMNMLILFLSGRIFRDFLGSTRILSTFVFGGLSGYLFYMLSYNIFPIFSQEGSVAVIGGASAGEPEPL